jgi:hypothetical protein
MPAPMTKSRGATRKMELGFKIELTASHGLAESAAKMREEIEDKQEAVKRLLDDLREAMKSDKIMQVKVKAPGGTLYRFEIENRGERVKITKPR